LLDDARIRIQTQIREAQKTYGSVSGSTTLLVTMKRLFQAVLVEALKMLTEAVRVLAQVVKILVAARVLRESVRVLVEAVIVFEALNNACSGR
jgi:hypothetical protein